MHKTDLMALMPKANPAAFRRSDLELPAHAMVKHTREMCSRHLRSHANPTNFLMCQFCAASHFGGKKETYC